MNIRYLALVTSLAFCVIGGVARAASISGPTSSTSGSFTITWTSGYYLRLNGASWQYAGPPSTSRTFASLPSGDYVFELWTCYNFGGTVACGKVSGTEHTVSVTRDAEIPIASTSEAGTTPYNTDVTRRGSATFNVPVRAIPGVNGLQPAISVNYDSHRQGDITDLYAADDVLGYGVSLEGVSRIHRCQTTGALTYLCLDGTRLNLLSGSYWNTNATYSPENNPLIRVTQKSSSGVSIWFQVEYPDGSVAKFGDTTASQVIASGEVNSVGNWVGLNPVYTWGIRHVANGHGDVMTYTYEKYEEYGMMTIKSIDYSGAKIEFKYGPRSDLDPTTVDLGTSSGTIRRQSYLHTIRVLMNGKKVREYRLDSNVSGGNNRLYQLQECGYNEAGSVATCLEPLELYWVTQSGGTSPIVVRTFTDGLEAKTQFYYTAISGGSHARHYSEAPFGSTIAPSATGQSALVVHDMRKSDGIGSGTRQWQYWYKGNPWKDDGDRGFIGFYEVKVRDVDRGIYTYYQTRLDHPFIGRVSATRAFNNTFGSHTEYLGRSETSWNSHTTGGNIHYPYVERRTIWQQSLTGTFGGSEEIRTPCFRTLSSPSSGSCPTSGTLHRYPTQLKSETKTGQSLGSNTNNPQVWGEVPNWWVNGVEMTRTVTTNFHNDASNWVLNQPARITTTNDATGETAKTVVQTQTYFTGTATPKVSDLAPGTSNNLKTTYTLSGNNLWKATITGSDFTSRVVSWTSYTQDRYPTVLSNALNQHTDLVYDLRFGLPKESEDPDGNTTYTDYDPFGRVIRTEAPDGTETTIDYASCGLYCAVPQGAVKITSTTTNGSTQVAPKRVVYLDKLQRQVGTDVEAFDSGDGWHRTIQQYDTKGRLQYVSRPFFSSGSALSCGTSSHCTKFTYDRMNRVTRTDRPDGGYTTHSWGISPGSIRETITETVKRPGLSNVTRRKEVERNELGQIVQTIDAKGMTGAVTTTYDYDSNGNLDSVVTGGKTVATISYDALGNRTQLVEPNTGTTTFDVDGLGQILDSTDALGQTTKYTYDKLGRVTQRVDRYGQSGAVTNTWNWDAPYATGALESRSNNYFTEDYTYRASDGKLTQIDTDMYVPGIINRNYTRSYSYDSQGRVSSRHLPPSPAPAVVTYDNIYNARGYLTLVKQNSIVRHAWTATDVWGNWIEEEFYNNASRTVRTHDSLTGRLLTQKTGTPSNPTLTQDLEYKWRSNGSMHQRIDRQGTDRTDTATYDALERLTRLATTGGTSRQLDFGYSAYANLTSKTSNVSGDLDVSYSYGSSSIPHRLTSATIAGTSNTLVYDSGGNITRYNATSGDDTYLDYDGRGFVTKVTVGSSSTTSSPTARDQFWYDPDGIRFVRKETWDDNGVQRNATTVYLGDYEEYLPPAGHAYTKIQRYRISDSSTFIFRVKPDSTYEAWNRFVHRDALGSVDATSNHAGSVASDVSFDPYGGRREGDWSEDITQASMDDILEEDFWQDYRGFTGHEQLNRTGLIHMNGRVYDPRLGRFVSADPLVPSPFFSQSYNRYAYVLNNPLSLVDPSGFDPKPKNNFEDSEPIVRPPYTDKDPVPNTYVRAPRITDFVFFSVNPDAVKVGGPTGLSNEPWMQPGYWERGWRAREKFGVAYGSLMDRLRDWGTPSPRVRDNLSGTGYTKFDDAFLLQAYDQVTNAEQGAMWAQDNYFGSRSGSSWFFTVAIEETRWFRDNTFGWRRPIPVSNAKESSLHGALAIIWGPTYAITTGRQRATNTIVWRKRRDDLTRNGIPIGVHGIIPPSGARSVVRFDAVGTCRVIRGNSGC